MHVHDLPDECLQSVFAQLPLQDKLFAAPLVCRKWCEVLSQPSQAWKTLQFDDRVFDAPGCSRVNAPAFIHWLKARSTSLKRLELQTSRELSQNGESLLLHTLLQVSGLEELLVYHFPMDYVILLQHLTGLKTLLLRITGDPRSAANSKLLCPLTKLTRLTQLHLKLPRSPGSGLPAFPVAVASLTNLQKLSVHAVDDLPDSISKLVKLQDLTVHSSKFPDNVTYLKSLSDLTVVVVKRCEHQTIPLSVSKLVNLRSLTLDIRKERHPAFYDGVSLLTNLVQLSVRDSHSRFDTVPGFVEQLCFLEDLKLSHIRQPEIPSSIVRLPRLKSLCLAYSRLDTAVEVTSCITQLAHLQRLTVGSRLRVIVSPREPSFTLEFRTESGAGRNSWCLDSDIPIYLPRHLRVKARNVHEWLLTVES